MSDYKYDLFVIGGGSGGIRAARMSANMGAKVALAESRHLGGTCVNVGCVPKKIFVYASHFSEECKNAEGLGWSINNKNFAWQKLIANKNQEIQRLNAVYEKNLNNANVEILNGKAKIKDSHTVEINKQHITAKNILIATGGWPSIPDISGKEHIISSNEVFFLKELPKEIVIVGGGYIAVEFAGIFNGLGVKTTLLYRGSLFLRGFDSEVRKILADEMKKKGIKIKFDSNLYKIEKLKNNFIATLETGEQINTEQILYATGRKPMSNELDLEQIGINTDENHAIKINAYYQTNIKSIYAIGDVTNRINLTPVALAEGEILAKRLFANITTKVDYENIPSCIFSQPNLATVGLTEKQAFEKYKDIAVYKTKFTPMKYSLSNNNEKVFMKLIVDRKSDLVVGAHMLGSDAGEIIQGIAIAIKAGATKKVFDSTLGIHPTTAEEFVSMREEQKSS